jgi:MFS transporter, DHA2 family, multidrug resistance protein
MTMSTTPEQPTARATRREWIGLSIIALPCLLYSMDLTVLNLAIPKLSAELRPSSAQLLWIVDIYGFVLAGLLIPMGTLGDRIGRRKVLLFGAAAFGAASIFAAFAHSASMLVAARAVLGVGGATIAPSTLSLIRNMFHDDKQRSVAIGVWIASFSAGGAIGPLLGGVLLEYFWPGSVFLVSVPVMVLLLVVGPLLLPEYRDPSARSVDVSSVLLSLAAVLLVIYGVKRVATAPGLALPAVTIVAGVVGAIVFVRRQSRIANPLIDPTLFANARFVSALAAYTVGTLLGFGIWIFTSQYLQLVKGLSPLAAGVTSLPVFAGFTTGAFVAPVMARRIGVERLMIGGFVGTAIGFALLGLATTASPLALIVVALGIYSLALSPIFVLATDLIVGSAPAEQAGAASALSETGSEFGGAAGIAVLGSIGTAVYRHAMSLRMPAGVPGPVADGARNTIGEALRATSGMTGAVSESLHRVAQDAFTSSLNVTAWSCVVVSLLMAVALGATWSTSRAARVHAVRAVE